MARRFNGVVAIAATLAVAGAAAADDTLCSKRPANLMGGVAREFSKLNNAASAQRSPYVDVRRSSDEGLADFIGAVMANCLEHPSMPLSKAVQAEFFMLQVSHPELFVR